MIREDFLKKFPRPWTFEQTDPQGTGVLLDANGYPLVILWVDMDWDDSGEDVDAEEPAFQIDEEHADALISILTDTPVAT
jgi:hypothetical protein